MKLLSLLTTMLLVLGFAVTSCRPSDEPPAPERLAAAAAEILENPEAADRILSEADLERDEFEHALRATAEDIDAARRYEAELSRLLDERG